MVLASACLRGIHPPDNIQNGGRPGGNASQTRTGLDHGVSILMMNHGVAAVTRVDLLCTLFCGCVFHNARKTFNLFKCYLWNNQINKATEFSVPQVLVFIC